MKSGYEGECLNGEARVPEAGGGPGGAGWCAVVGGIVGERIVGGEVLSCAVGCDVGSVTGVVTVDVCSGWGDSGAAGGGVDSVTGVVVVGICPGRVDSSAATSGEGTGGVSVEGLDAASEVRGGGRPGVVGLLLGIGFVGSSVSGVGLVPAEQPEE